MDDQGCFQRKLEVEDSDASLYEEKGSRSGTIALPASNGHFSVTMKQFLSATPS